ncbi:MAG: CDP-diacylglycerol--serine O-phosphatidyltransferase [Methylophilus sp.]|nr:CDP-diacylglycerol--serine O-phosphatidyltransferase [Methylophilus sp.]
MVERKQRPARRVTDNQSLRERGIYLLPNLFTSAALFSGFYAIVQAMNAHFELAAIAIFIAMVMDGLDGRVARMTNTQSAFGAEYDSLSDMVSFGVAPALIMYVWALQPMQKLGWIAAFLYCACAALRLARFNTKLDDPFQDKRFFQGLPSPAAAALLAGFVWVSYEYNVDGHEIFFGAIQMKWLAWTITVFAAGSMVSDLKFYSGKDINLKDSVPFMAILAIVIAFVLVSYSPPEVLFTVVFVYALSGYYIWINQRLKKET